MKVESRKVLFVDDNPDSTELFEIIALQSDIKPTVCNDSTDALKLLEAEEFDAVILDLSMPVIDGLTLAEEIRQNEQNKPHKKPVCIIFYTARTIDGAIQRVAQRVGVERIYQKGGNKDLSDILMEVKSICGERQMYVHKKAENGSAPSNWIVCLVAVMAQILSVSVFMWLYNKQDVAAAYRYSEMKNERDHYKRICDSNYLLNVQKGQFIQNSSLQMPPTVAGELPCKSARENE
jgi:CheY-like chemotaxis protein